MFVGCESNNPKEGTFNYEVAEEIQLSLNRNDPQVNMALCDNLEPKEQLIESEDLNANGLLAFCSKPEPYDIDNEFKYYVIFDAFKRVKLTPGQENLIVRLNAYVYDIALLHKDDLSSEGLIAISKAAEGLFYNTPYNVNLVEKAVKRADLTPEDEIEIAQSKLPAFLNALLLRENLSSKGLVAVCENLEGYALEDADLIYHLEKALEKTSLTQEQKERIMNTKIAELGIYQKE